MSEKKTFSVQMPQGLDRTAGFASAALTLASALQTVLKEERDQQGTNAKTWLDELEKRLIRDAKGSVTEGIAIQVEAPALQYSVYVLQAVLDSVRAGIIDGDQKD